MKIFIFLFILFLLQGCFFKQKIDVKFLNDPTAKKSNIYKATISNVKIINNQLVINGNNLDVVTKVAVKNSALSFDENFSIETINSNQIIANGTKAISMAVNSIFDLIISDAKASASFTIDFSLCNATLNSKAIDCSVTATDKDVLSYDATTQKWRPRSVNGLSYLGAWDASANGTPSAQPSGSYYIVGVAGSIGGVFTVNVGDWVVSNGASWQKIDNSNAIISVYGRTGLIVAQKGDYSITKMSDVDTTTTPPTNGQFLKYDGANWVPASISVVETDPTVKTFAKNNLPTCNAGEVLKSNGTALSCVTDNAGTSFTGTANKAVITIGTGALATATTSDTELNYLVGTSSNVQVQLNAKEGTLATGTAAQYFKGNKTLSTFATDVIASTLSGFAVGANSTVLAADSVLSAFEKTQGQINATNTALTGKLNTTGGTLTVGTINGVPNPTNNDDVANKAYVDAQVGAAGNWTTTGPDVYRASGKVGIGTSTPNYVLNLKTVPTTNQSLFGITTNVQTIFDVVTDGNNDGKINVRSSGGTTQVSFSAGTSSSYVLGNMGVGTNTPAVKLDVNGAVKIGVDATACSGTNAGAIRFNTPNIEYCNGTAWAAFSTGSGVTSVNGNTGVVVLTTTGIAEGTNLYYTNARGIASTITAPTLTNAAIASGDTLQIAAGKLQAQINSKENSLSSGGTTQYFRGDKSLSTFATDVIASTLSGFAVGANSTVLATDSILGAFGKTQAQINAHTTALAGKLNTTGGTLSVGTINGVPNPTNNDDVANKAYVDSQVSGAGNWTAGFGNVYRTTGNVGIGTTSPSSPLEIQSTLSAATGLSDSGAYMSRGISVSDSNIKSGLYLDLNAYQSGALSNIVGLRNDIGTDNGTVSEIDNYTASHFGNGGTVNARYGLRVSDSTGAGTVTNQYGVYVDSMTKGSSNNFAFFSAGNTKSSFGGKVGIGTTSPSTLLDVNGNVNFSGAASFGDTVNFNGFLKDVILNSGRILGASSIGINTTPVYQLDVNANNGTPYAATSVITNTPTSTTGIRSQNTAIADNSGSYFSMTTTNGSNIPQSSYIGSISNSTGTTPTIVIGQQTAATAYAERMRIDKNGKVGIGILNPASMLDVNGSVRVGADATACSGTNAGAMRFTTPNIEYCNGSAWTAFSTSGGPANTDALTEGSTNLYFSNSRAIASTITAPTLTNSAITNGDTILAALGKLQGQFNNVLTNLLSTYSLGTNAVISTADTIIGAFGKLQKQISDLSTGKLDKTGGTLSVGTINGVPTPTNSDDVANKGYVDSYAQWTKSGTNAYRSTGNIGIGDTPSGTARLYVDGYTRLNNTASTDTFEYPLELKRERSGATPPSAGFGAGLGFALEGFTNYSAPMAGEIGVLWENNQTNDTTDRDSTMTFSTRLDDTLSAKMKITSAGNVGVGVASPETNLDVNSAITMRGAYFEKTGALGTLACGATNITGFNVNLYTLTACASGTTTLNIPTVTGWPAGNMSWNVSFFVTGQTASVFNVTYNGATTAVYWDRNSTGTTGGNGYAGFTVNSGSTDVISCAVMNTGSVKVFCGVSAQY